MDLYESEPLLGQYLLFHYGSAEEQLPWPGGPQDALFYPVRTVTELLGGLPGLSGKRALDIGCAVGRSAFELARTHLKVVGIDYSQSFIEAAAEIRHAGHLNYRYPVEGDCFAEATARVPAGIDPGRVSFCNGDAMNLPADLGKFSLVHASNLIDRLPDPCRFLEKLPSIVEPGGHAVLASPFTWLREFTPEDHWIGGTAHATSEEALGEVLSADFDLVLRKDLPFVIREHVRKYQWSVAWATVWRRKG